MYLRYRVEDQDLAAFARYHYQNSPVVKRRIMVWRWLTALSGFLIIAVLAYFLDWAIYSILAPIVALILYFQIPRSIFKQLEKDIIKLYGEGANKSLFGEHRLTIKETGLEAKSKYSKTFIEFSGIERMGETMDYTFIYFNAMTAAPICRKSVLEGDYESFVNTLKSRPEASKK